MTVFIVHKCPLLWFGVTNAIKKKIDLTSYNLLFIFLQNKTLN